MVEEKARESRLSWRSLRVWMSLREGRLGVSFVQRLVQLLDKGMDV